MLREFTKEINGTEYGTTELSGYDFVMFAALLESVNNNFLDKKIIEEVFDLQAKRGFFYDKKDGSKKVFFDSLDHLKKHFEVKKKDAHQYITWCLDIILSDFRASEQSEESANFLGDAPDGAMQKEL